MRVSIVFLGSFPKVDLYSISIIGKDSLFETNEFDKFSELMKSDPESLDAGQFEEVEALINDITYFSGAVESKFRSEGNNKIFSAIPSPFYRFFGSDGISDFGLRLYCVRVSDEILILLNGCRKTHQNPTKCPNCNDLHLFAEKFAESFYDELNVNKNILIDERYILNAADIDNEDIEDVILNIRYEKK